MKKNKQKIKSKSRLIANKKILAFTVLFAFFAIFGLGLITNNAKKGVENGKASSIEPADFNNDNKVDVFDLSELLNAWGSNNSTYDISKNSIIDVFDLSILLARWGAVNASNNINIGAQLPIHYSRPTTNVKYVATNGSDSNAGTEASPYKSVQKAVNSVTDGGTVIIRGGTYSIKEQKDIAYNLNNQTNSFISVNKNNISIKAFPGETPIFDGSKQSNSSWTGEGSLKYVAYTPMETSLSGAGIGLLDYPDAFDSKGNPINGSDIKGWRCIVVDTSGAQSISTNTTCANSNKVVVAGYYPDQVWINGQNLMQVIDKDKVTDANKFYVDRTNNRLYLHTTASSSGVSFSESGGAGVKGVFMWLSSSKNGFNIEGLVIKNHSPSTNGGYTIQVGGDKATIKNVEIDSNTSQAISPVADSTNLIVNDLIVQNVTFNDIYYMAIAGQYHTNTTIDSTKFSGIDIHNEFRPGPARGAIKFTKAHGAVLKNSLFEKVNNFGFWCDQSCYDTTVASNYFYTKDSAMFYEISHKLTFVNNYVDVTRDYAGGPTRTEPDKALRLAASSGLRLVNNTIIGGNESAIHIGVDARSRKYDSDSNGTPDRYCSEHIQRYNGTNSPAFTDVCNNGMDSDLDKKRLGAYSSSNQTLGLNWLPTADMIINNVLYKPMGSPSCGLICANAEIGIPGGSNTNKPKVSLNSIFYTQTSKIDNPNTGSTIINGNVYQISSGNIAKFKNDISVDAGEFTATTMSALKGSLSSSNYGLVVEANGQSSLNGLVDDNGTIINSTLHSSAALAPTDVKIQPYISSGEQYYGSKLTISLKGIPVGLFMVPQNGSYGIYKSYGNSYCFYNDWTLFTSLTGRSNTDGISIFNSIPSTMSYLGICKD